MVSAVNLIEGGTLTVLRDCLAAAAKELPPEWRIVALVHDKGLVTEPRIELIEVKDAKGSWLRRVLHEWVGFRRLSLILSPDLWLSLHDITPRVVARRQAVYCHNPAPFYSASWREARLDPSFWLFNKFYRFLYGSFIRRNHIVIVQQSWLRTAFWRLFGPLPIVVAHPSITLRLEPLPATAPATTMRFLYPSFPRVHKNFEIICEAARLLEQRCVSGFEVRLTLDGTENSYSRWLHGRYNRTESLRFIGLQNRDEMAQEYINASVVLFPGKLETWGLPISEAKAYGKPLLVSDLPYAHETVGSYERVSFFQPFDVAGLADLMQQIIDRQWTPTGSLENVPAEPYARDWKELWALLVKDL